MRFYWPIAKVDAEQRMVWGYASTEAADDHGETVTRAALTAALDDYMRFANIREMHQLSAVGVATAAAVDSKGLYVAAKIVDGDAWEKVVEGVYKGFSIGGRVTGRDPADRKIITALRLTEISVVDRPANPEAVFDCWKLADDTLGGAAPAQVWDCGDAGHRHLAKAEALRCIAERDDAPAAAPEEPPPGEPAHIDPGHIDYADPGYQEDGRPRYPLDTESHIRAAWAYIHQADNATRYTPGQLAHVKARIVAAWHLKIDPAGPPAAQSHPPHPPHEVAAHADDLQKALGHELAAGLAKLCDSILPRLDMLQRRVEEIARTPLPPQTAARGLVAIEKRADGAYANPYGDDIVTALARMSEEERTLALIKAAHQSPIRR